MKVGLAFLLAIFPMFVIIGQPAIGVIYKGYAEYLSLSKSMIEMDYYNFSIRKNVALSCKYMISNIDGIDFIDIGPPITSRWLILGSSQFLVLYKDANDSYFMGGIGEIEGFRDLRKALPYSATSYLSLDGTDFEALNLGTTQPDHPWIAGSTNNGIGAKLLLHCQIWEDQAGQRDGMHSLVISNGYVSYDKPSRYHEYARVKKILVSSEDADFNFSFTLQDTPNPQIVPLPSPPKTVTIEIISIYPAKDTNKPACLNFIFADGGSQKH